MAKKKSDKVWAARFAKATDPRAEAFTAAIDVDRRLWPYDIAGSIAHARMLAKQGIIPQEDGEAIVRGLAEIGEEIEAGRFEFRRELEDIHMNIEARLRQKIGLLAPATTRWPPTCAST
jgi:argininosuccinate lyase